jgi:hypothetical protein
MDDASPAAVRSLETLAEEAVAAAKTTQLAELRRFLSHTVQPLPP